MKALPYEPEGVEVDRDAQASGGTNPPAHRHKAVSPAPMPCGKAPCPEHGTPCAFHGDEPGRCRWCHSPWARIIGTGRHSCEAAAIWPSGDRGWRIATAIQMRLDATTEPHAVDEGPFCSHLGAGLA